MKQLFMMFQRTDKDMAGLLLDVNEIESLSVGERKTPDSGLFATIITMRSGDTWSVNESMLEVHDRILKETKNESQRS